MCIYPGLKKKIDDSDIKHGCNPEKSPEKEITGWIYFLSYSPFVTQKKSESTGEKKQ